MARYKGIIYTVLSAVIFGFTPALARITYDEGSNGITVTFLRALLALPVLFLILKKQGIPLRLTPKQLRDVIFVGVLGTSTTTVMLYMSYNWISVGMATTLHFIYPILITLVCIVFFKEKLNIGKLCALVMASVGVFCFMDGGSAAAWPGLALALISGATYTLYVVFMDKSGLKNMYYFLLSFYLCVIMAISSGLYGLATGSLNLALTPKGWIFSLIISLLTSVGALTLFQIGIRLCGASTAAILSTLEPITSIVMGIWVLGEELNWVKAVGCILILVSVVLITLAERKKQPLPILEEAGADEPAEESLQQNQTV